MSRQLAEAQAEIERMRSVVGAANSIVDDWNDKYKQDYLWKTLCEYEAEEQPTVVTIDEEKS